MKKKVVSLFLVTVIGLGCIGCGVKVEPKATQAPLTQTEVQTETKVQETQIQETEQATEQATEQDVETTEETNFFATSEITNLNEMVQEISKNVNGSAGYLLDQAKEKGYQNFAMIVSNKGLYDEELCSKLEKLDIPFTVNFCLLAKNVDNEYSYFYYKYNDVNKMMEIEEEPLIDNTKGKVLDSIGFIKEYNLMYTKIISDENTFEIFSNENGKIAVRNKLDVTTYINGVDDGIATSYTTFSKTYDKYIGGMKEVEFSKDIDNIKSY